MTSTGSTGAFAFTTDGAISTTLMTNTSQPIYASSALLFIGTADV